MTNQTTLRKPAAESIAETTGTYQDFIGGQIYIRRNFWNGDRTYYLSGKIAGYYNDQKNCRVVNGNTLCGSGGVFGFPTSDQQIANGKTEQKFEETNLAYDQKNNAVVEYAQSKDSRRFQNKEFARRQVCLAGVDLDYCSKLIGNASLITDIEAFANLANYIAKRAPDNETFVRDITTVLTGSETMFWYTVNDMINANSEFDIQGFSDTGFKFDYNDSHYCTDNLPGADLDYRCISNQLFHSMLGFNHAFFYGKEAADKKTREHDKNPSPLGIGGENYQDLWLGAAVSILGENLKKGETLKEGAGQWILSVIADPDYKNMAVSQKNQVRVKEYRKKFRIMEYQLNGNVRNKWWYNRDMQKYSCGGNIGDVYYQDYEYIFVGGKNVGRAKAVWDEKNNKMLLMYWGLRDEYDKGKNICNDFNQLIRDHGFNLQWSFSDLVSL